MPSSYPAARAGRRRPAPPAAPAGKQRGIGASRQGLWAWSEAAPGHAAPRPRSDSPTAAELRAAPATGSSAGKWSYEAPTVTSALRRASAPSSAAWAACTPRLGGAHVSALVGQGCRSVAGRAGWCARASPRKWPRCRAARDALRQRQCGLGARQFGGLHCRRAFSASTRARTVLRRQVAPRTKLRGAALQGQQAVFDGARLAQALLRRQLVVGGQRTCSCCTWCLPHRPAGLGGGLAAWVRRPRLLPRSQVQSMPMDLSMRLRVSTLPPPTPFAGRWTRPWR